MKYYICPICKMTFVTLTNKKKLVHCNHKIRELDKEKYRQHLKNVKGLNDGK